MGSKPWHKLTALVALSFLAVGCNNTPQKSNSVASQTAQNGAPGSPQTAQTGPYNGLPKFPTALLPRFPRRRTRSSRQQAVRATLASIPIPAP